MIVTLSLQNKNSLDVVFAPPRSLASRPCTASFLSFFFLLKIPLCLSFPSISFLLIYKLVDRGLKCNEKCSSRVCHGSVLMQISSIASFVYTRPCVCVCTIVCDPIFSFSLSPSFFHTHTLTHAITQDQAIRSREDRRRKKGTRRDGFVERPKRKEGRVSYFYIFFLHSQPLFEGSN